MKQLFFDFDGTIANSEPGIVHGIEYMLMKMGLPALSAADYRSFIGPSLTSSLERYFPELTDADYATAVKYYQEQYQQSGIFELSLYPGILTALTTLQEAGYRLNIASAKPEPMVKRIVKQFDLDSYFSGIYGATLDESQRSTKTAVLAYGLAQSGAVAAQSLMIGDRDTDMRGGLENRVRTLGVTYGFGSAAELQDAQATAIVSSPEALPEGVTRLYA